MDKIQYKSYSLILLVLLFVVGCIILLFWVYDVCWPDHFTISHGQKIVGFWGYHLITVIFSSLFIGVALHEFTHGLTMSYFLGWKWDSIEFGFSFSSLYAFCHCKCPLLRNQYLICVFMPTLVLGLLPIVFGIGIGILYLFLFGVFQFFSGFMDLYIALTLLNVPVTACVIDHPKKVGYQLVFKGSDISIH